MEATAPERYLHVTAYGGPFGVPLRQLRSVEPLARIVPVPNAPAWLRGVNYREGRVHAVADLNALLDPAASFAPDATARMLIVADDEFALAVVVAAASDVFVAPPEQIEPPATGQVAGRFVIGQIHRPDGTLRLLDLRALLRAPEAQITG